MGAYYEMIGEKNKGEKNGAHMNATWDATGYERDFSFVPSYGEGVIDLIDVRPGETCLHLWLRQRRAHRCPARARP